MQVELFFRWSDAPISFVRAGSCWRTGCPEIWLRQIRPKLLGEFSIKRLPEVHHGFR